MINTNNRRVKRTLTGHTLMTEAQHSSLKKDTLCSHCCEQRSCRIKGEYADLEGESIIVSCPSFKMPMKFRDVTGLDLKVWNTIRLGTSYDKKLEVGDVIGLLNAEDLLFGYVELAAKFSGHMDRLLHEHARRNHMLLANRMNAIEAAQTMRSILRNVYGKLPFESASEISVLYFKRLAVVGGLFD